MANENYPLLFFPWPTLAKKNPGNRPGPQPNTPAIDRQRARITPQLSVLQEAFNAKRLRLQQNAPMENPELILVFEVAGTVKDFANAVSKVSGLEWLLEWAEEAVAPDDDFYIEGKEEKPFSGRLFLLASNQEALAQLLSLWDRFQKDRAAKFDRGLAPFRHLFSQLRTIRHWNVADRINADVRQYWQERLDDGTPAIRFETEAWYFDSPQKNDAARAEIEALVQGLGGHTLSRALIPEIAYHGFLVELPAAAIADVLAGGKPELVLSDRVMFFRPKTQSVTDGLNEAQQVVVQADVPGVPVKPPLVALLDGFPLQNHVLLAGRLEIDDPDGWEAGYTVKDRVHGTAMASLILHGELDGTPSPPARRLYVRPVLRPDPTDTFNQRRREHTPDEVLLIDLIHRAVKRICEGEGDQPSVAPTVRVINLSIGYDARIFERDMSPWARLLDWLAFRYSILFIVSAGNDDRPLSLDTPRNTLTGLTADARAALALVALTSESVDRRLLVPSEAMNALTVGAIHTDQAQPIVVPNRFDLFASGGLSPLSRIGHGFRRAVKPDILMSGGRALYREQIPTNPAVTVVEAIKTSAAPGHRVAIPPLPGGTLSETGYSRGTSNAAAFASRAAVQAYEVVEALRAEVAEAPEAKFDAVLLKALLVHGAHWGEWADRLLAQRPDFDWTAKKDFVTRWLGYGLVDVERGITCTAERATLLGVGELGADEAFVFSAPLPPSLAGKKAWRRLTITLAWLSPINPSHQGYRRAKLWVTPPQDQLRVKRSNSVHDKTALRGTVQHEILEGEYAVAFVDGDRFECKVNCAADAGELFSKVPFALCVSLEVAVGSGIPIYQEIRERIATAVGIQPVTR